MKKVDNIFLQIGNFHREKKTIKNKRSNARN